MKITDHPFYQEDLARVAGMDLPWEMLKNKSVMLSGATGLIGSFFVDVIMHMNIHRNLNCKVYALGRNEERAKSRFAYCCDSEQFVFIPYDINLPFMHDDIENIDFVIHLASNTHPVAYATDPIGTITTNIIGTQNMLEFAYTHHASRCAFASSNEVYGENRGDVEIFEENYCGYIDCNTLRAGYPESKRCGEALCQAYIKQKGMDIVIPRLTRSYGPTMLMSDTKAISQFIRKAIAGEDIILKSSGTQYYSYTYMADAVSGLIYVLLKGKCGEAYNIADVASDITLRDLADVIAKTVKREVVFEIPDNTESIGYSKATKARLDSTKLRKLNWIAYYDINKGIKRTIRIIKDIKRNEISLQRF